MIGFYFYLSGEYMLGFSFSGYENMSLDKLKHHIPTFVMELLSWFLIVFVSSKDILMRVIAQNLPPETTAVEKVIFLH